MFEAAAHFVANTNYTRKAVGGSQLLATLRSSLKLIRSLISRTVRRIVGFGRRVRVTRCCSLSVSEQRMRIDRTPPSESPTSLISLSAGGNISDIRSRGEKPGRKPPHKWSTRNGPGGAPEIWSCFSANFRCYLNVSLIMYMEILRLYPVSTD